jgi:acyl carrier protein
MNAPSAGGAAMSAEAAVISIVVAGLLFWLAVKWDFALWGQEARFNAEYRARPPMSDAKLIETYYKDSSIDPAIPVGVRRIFGEQLGYEPERLRPDDDFMFLFMELDAVELVTEIEEAFDVHISNEDLEKIKPTIRGMAELVQRIRTAKHPIG